MLQAYKWCAVAGGILVLLAAGIWIYLKFLRTSKVQSQKVARLEQVVTVMANNAIEEKDVLDVCNALINQSNNRKPFTVRGQPTVNGSQPNPLFEKMPDPLPESRGMPRAFVPQSPTGTNRVTAQPGDPGTHRKSVHFANPVEELLGISDVFNMTAGGMESIPLMQFMSFPGGVPAYNNGHPPGTPRRSSEMKIVEESDPEEDEAQEEQVTFDDDLDSEGTIELVDIGSDEEMRCEDSEDEDVQCFHAEGETADSID